MEIDYEEMAAADEFQAFGMLYELMKVQPKMVVFEDHKKFPPYKMAIAKMGMEQGVELMRILLCGQFDNNSPELETVFNTLKRAKLALQYEGESNVVKKAEIIARLFDIPEDEELIEREDEIATTVDIIIHSDDTYSIEYDGLELVNDLREYPDSEMSRAVCMAYARGMRKGLAFQISEKIGVDAADIEVTFKDGENEG